MIQNIVSILATQGQGVWMVHFVHNQSNIILDSK